MSDLLRSKSSNSVILREPLEKLRTNTCLWELKLKRPVLPKNGLKGFTMASWYIYPFNVILVWFFSIAFKVFFPLLLAWLGFLKNIYKHQQPTQSSHKMITVHYNMNWEKAHWETSCEIGTKSKVAHSPIIQHNSQCEKVKYKRTSTTKKWYK